MADTTGTRTIFSRTGVKAMYIVFTLFYALVLLAGGLQSGVPGWAQALAWLGLASAGLLIWRIAQLAVVATPAGLSICNFWNRHSVPWAEIEEIFQPGPVPLAVYKETALPKVKAGLFVRLREGAVISCTMYSNAFWANWSDNYRAIREAVEALNELRCGTPQNPAPATTSPAVARICYREAARQDARVHVRVAE